MVEAARLAVVVDSDTKPMDAGLAGAETRLKGFGDRVTGIGSLLGTALTVGAVAGTAAIVGGLGASVAAAAGFEKQMSEVKAVSGATGKEMKTISDLALQLGKDTSFSASEAAAGITELVKGGLSLTDVTGGAAKSMLDLAAAGGVSLPDAATIAANALAQFNLKGSDMAHVADLIAGAANASALDVGQFKLSLSAAGAVASTVGFKFDDLAQAIAVMGKAGITGSDAGTSLKTMMLNLTPQTDKAAGLMKDLGLMGFDTAKAMTFLKDRGIKPLGDSAMVLEDQMMHVLNDLEMGSEVSAKATKNYQKEAEEIGLYGNKFFDATGKVKSMAEVSQILQNATKDMTEETRLATLAQLFGTDAVRAAAVMAKEGAKGFETMAGAMGKVSAADVAKTRLDNLAGGFEQLKGSIETAAITLGLSLLPALRGAVDGATAFVNSLIPIFESVGPQIVDTLGKVAGTISDLFTSGGDVGLLADNLREAFGVDISGLIAGFNSTVATVRQTLTDLAPTGERIASVFATLRDAVVALIPQPLRDFVQGLLDSASAAGGGEPVLTRLTDAVNTVSGAVAEAVRWLKENEVVLYAVGGVVGALTAALVVQRTVLLAQAAATGIATVAQAALNLVMSLNPVGILIIALGALVGALVYFYQTNEDVRAVVDKVWAFLKVVVTATIAGFIASFKELVASVLWVAARFEEFKSTVSTAFEAVRSAIETKVEAARVAVEAFAENVLGLVRALAAMVPEEAWKVGQSLIDGIAGGIRAGWDFLTNLVTDLANSLKDAAMRAIKGGSPSMEFWTVGASIVEGMALGITDTIPLMTGALGTLIDSAFAQIEPFNQGAAAKLRNALTSATSGIATDGIDPAQRDRLMAGIPAMMKSAGIDIPAFEDQIRQRLGGLLFAPGFTPTLPPGLGTSGPLTYQALDPTRSVNVNFNLNGGAVYGSLADLATRLEPELARARGVGL